MLLEHERDCGLCMDALVTVSLGTLLWLGHGCSGYCMFLEHERYYGLRVDALVTVCAWNANVIMVRAWVLWLLYALGTRKLFWLRHGCSSYRMLVELNVIMVSAWMLWLPYALGTRASFWLSMDALVTVCSWNKAVIVVAVWAWMLWLPYVLGTRALLWFGHGCSGCRMLLEHERDCGLSMDALVIVRTTLWCEQSPNLSIHKPSTC